MQTPTTIVQILKDPEPRAIGAACDEVVASNIVVVPPPRFDTFCFGDPLAHHARRQRLWLGQQPHWALRKFTGQTFVAEFNRFPARFWPMIGDAIEPMDLPLS